VFYFSGHGAREVAGGREQSWLLPSDTDLDDLSTAALSSDALLAYFNRIASKRQAIIIDACHAGGIGSAKGSRSVISKGLGASALKTLSEGAGRVLLTSSKSEESSWVLPGEHNSVFTNALLEALRGNAIDRGDGLVRVLDVFDYVSSEVPKRASQNPIFHAGDLQSNFALTRRDVAPEGTAIDINALAAMFSDLYPAGPKDERIWSRAGGDLSRLDLSGSGFAQWHSALSKANAGGGGLTIADLLLEASREFPEHPVLSIYVDGAE
jgi:hypothetical protein